MCESFFTHIYQLNLSYANTQNQRVSGCLWEVAPSENWTAGWRSCKNKSGHFYFLERMYRKYLAVFVTACLHGGGGPQEGEVTHLGGVTCLFI